MKLQNFLAFTRFGPPYGTGLWMSEKEFDFRNKRVTSTTKWCSSSSSTSGVRAWGCTLATFRFDLTPPVSPHSQAKSLKEQNLKPRPRRRGAPPSAVGHIRRRQGEDESAQTRDVTEEMNLPQEPSAGTDLCTGWLFPSIERLRGKCF